MSDTQASHIYSDVDSPYYSTAPIQRDVRRPAFNKPSLPEDQLTPLAKLVGQTKLPQCIRITKNFLAPGSHSRLKKGDVLMLHFVYVKPVIHAVDTKTGQALRLPLYARQEFEILPQDPSFDDKEYDGTGSLIDAKPSPKFVRVVAAHSSPHPDEQQTMDDIVEIEKIEVDKERGEVLVGMTTDPVSHRVSPFRFSREMTSSTYTTMLIPGFKRLSELKDLEFPQRVRLPDSSSGSRIRKSERVLRLEKYCEESCVLATRGGDAHAYCLPLSTPLSLERLPMPAEKQLSVLMSPLYGSINTTWGVVDLTQGGLPPLLEEIPQPMKEVLVAWLESWEGKRHIEKVFKKFDADKAIAVEKKDAEIIELKSSIESYKRELRQAGLIETPPARPPRSKPAQSKTPPLPIPAKPPRPAPATSTLPSLDRRAPLSKPPLVPQTRPVSTPETKKDDDGSDEYEYVSELKSVFQKDPSDEEYSVVNTGNNNTDDGTLRSKYDDLWKEYNVVKEENEKLQNEKKELTKMIQWLQNQVDASEDYEMISDYSKLPSKRPDNYVKITSSKPDKPEIKDTKQGKVPVPVLPMTFPLKKRNSLPDFEKRPAVPTRTGSRNSDKGNNPPTPPRRVSLDDKETTPSSKENDKEIPFKRVTPPVPPKSSAPISKVTPPPSDNIYSTPNDDTNPKSRSVPVSPLQTSLDVHVGLTREEVGSFLKTCNLGKYSESFIKNDVDGELLLAIDEQIMTEELGLSKLDARKLSLALKKQKSS